MNARNLCVFSSDGVFGRHRSAIHRLINAIFDLLAFSTEGLLIGASFAFFLILLDLGRVLLGSHRPGRGHDTDFVLVPDGASRDPRRGFEIFAEPLQETLGVALLMYLTLYCVRLEGAYMRSSDAPSLSAFVQSDIWLGVVASAEKGKSAVSVLKYLFSTADQTQTVRGILAWLMALLVFAFSLIVVVMTIQQAAIRAKVRAERTPAVLSTDGVSVDTTKKDWMVVWPLGYLKLSNILVIMLLAACTLYLYRIGLFVAGFVVTGLFIKMVFGILNPRKT